MRCPKAQYWHLQAAVLGQEVVLHFRIQDSITGIGEVDTSTRGADSWPYCKNNRLNSFYYIFFHEGILINIILEGNVAM